MSRRSNIFDTVDLDALFQLIELRLRHLAMGADAITPEQPVRAVRARARAAINWSAAAGPRVEIEPAIEISRGRPSGR